MPILRSKMLGLFYRELASLVSSGITIIDAMDILSNQAGYALLKNTAVLMKQHLVGGSSLGSAFAQFPEIFPEWQVNMVKYSEAGGKLSLGLERLADYLEKDYAVQQSIIVGLSYPVFLLHVAIFLLPLTKGLCIGIVGYVAEVLKLIIPIYGLLFAAYSALRMQRFKNFKAILDGFLLNIPIFGTIVRQFALTRFIRALQCLTAAGVSIISGWKMAADGCGNAIIKNAVLQGLPVIEQGGQISKAFIQARVFSPHMVGMINAAEKSGNIVQILNSIATYSEKENETAVAVLAKIMPIFIYLAIAGYIGFRIISFYLSYYNRIFSF